MVWPTLFTRGYPERELFLLNDDYSLFNIYSSSLFDSYVIMEVGGGYDNNFKEDLDKHKSSVMKFILLFATLSTLCYPPEPILLIDTRLRKQVILADDYSADQLFQHKFPIHSTDLSLIIEKVEDMARKLDKGLECGTRDTIFTGHSIFYISTTCEAYKIVDIWMRTKVEEQTFAFHLVNKESDFRKAQLKLLNFMDYLSKWDVTKLPVEEHN